MPQDPPEPSIELAVRQLIERRPRLLYGVLKERVSDNDLDDVFQNCVARALEKSRTVTGKSTGEIVNWLKTLFRNAAIDYWRARRRQREVLSEEVLKTLDLSDDVGRHEQAAEHLDAVRCHDCWNKLNETEQCILNCTGRTKTEIVESCRCPVHRILLVRHAAIRKLRHCFQRRLITGGSEG